MKKLFFAVLLVSLTGCGSLIADALVPTSGTQLTDEQFKPYVVRNATKDEMVAVIGNPDRRVALKNGELFEYFYSTNNGLKAADSGKVVLEFNDRDVLVKEYRTGMTW